MSQEKQGIFRKARSFLFNIGDKAHRQLAEEKARSEGLLRRIEADLAQAARIQEDLRGYACGTQPCDDITLVVLKRTEA